MNVTSNSEICRLLSKGYFTQAKCLIFKNELNVNQTDENRRTPLILCSLIEDISWSLSLAQLLLELGADIDRTDVDKFNVIHYCVIFEQEDLLNLLLESVDFNIDTGDYYGNTPLIYAITVNNKNIINTLIQYHQRYKIDVDRANSRGINAFMQASLGGNFDLVEKLESLRLYGNCKDVNSRNFFSYKDNSLSKFKTNNHINGYRDPLGMIARYDDFERSTKSQEKLNSSKYNSEKSPELVDYNSKIVCQLKANLKKIKINRNDIHCVHKCLKASSNLDKDLLRNENLKIRQIRPQTAFCTSKDLLNRSDWYSFLGPLYISLEQQYSSSFKHFSKSEKQNLDSMNYHNEKPKNRQRRPSRSMGNYSRRNSITGRAPSSEDLTDPGANANKSRRKIEAVVAAKVFGRSLNKISSNTS